MIRMVLSGPVPSRLTPTTWVRAWRAVRPAMGSPAPSAADTSGGLGTVKFSLATAYSASPPPYCHQHDKERERRSLIWSTPFFLVWCLD